jgi:hypothetical protein
MPFTCSICEEDSTRICARCTKDACNNHLCERCLRCSDCCDCEVLLAEPVREPASTVFRSVASQRKEDAGVPIPAPEPAPHEPDPAPDPWPGEEEPASFLE